MLEFNDEFFKEETRVGEGYKFTIPEFMKHAWAAQLAILDIVDKICIENDIKYFADWGTLLGAVRHKGYIPWDDDLDICMMRDDYNRFCEIVENYGVKLNSCYNNPEHGFTVSRVINSTLFTVEREVYKQYFGFPFPAGLDIFIIDYVPRDKEAENEQIGALKMCALAFETREWLDEHSPIDKGYAEQLGTYKQSLKWLEKHCNIVFGSPL